MNESTENLQRKIGGATDLESVVRTMKALAASSVLQYERAVEALKDYFHTVELGLSVCLPDEPDLSFTENNKKVLPANILVFGTDLGLAGQFNELIAEYVTDTVKNIPGKKVFRTVGERIELRLNESGYISEKVYRVPDSVNGITPLITRILLDVISGTSEETPFFIFHNKPIGGSLYEPVFQKLLPLDKEWQKQIKKIKWPSDKIPEVSGSRSETLKALVHEYLFVSLFQACAQSLSSENTGRLMAMQRAEKNIHEMLDELRKIYHRIRQSDIDAELFDVISGFEAMRKGDNGD
jgi:F-type H+-transporting ATPase subunit gamma